MGGPRHDKRTKRAHEDLRRGLARRDAELACDGLLALPAPERDLEQLAAVAALCAQDVGQAHMRGEWGRLVPWAKRLEAEPRLLGALDPESTCRVRWALLWGCARSGDWVRAARLWAELAPEADARRPALAEAMSRWVASHGAPRPLPAAIAAFAPAAPDPRLGTEPIGPRSARVRELADPATPQDAQEAVVRARAALGSAGLAAWAAGALERADAETARALGEAATAMALRDLLVRMQDGGSDGRGPLDVVATCARRGVAPAGLLLTWLRIVVRSLREEKSAPSPDALCTIVRGCMQDASIAAIVRDALLGLASEVAAGSRAADVLLAALGAVAELAPNAAVWATGALLAVEQSERGDGHRRRPSRGQALSAAWLEQQAAAIAAQGDDLVAWMQSADLRARQKVLAFAADRLPANVAGPLLVAMASTDDERLRRPVACAVEDLLGRFSMGYCASCGFDHEPEQLSYRALSPVGRQLWDTLEGVSCDGSPALLSLALERAPSAAARGALIERFVDRADSGGLWLAAIALARRFRLRKLPGELLRRMVARFASEPGELAEAYQIAWDASGRTDVLVPLARALVEAVRASAVPAPARVAAVARRAQRMLDAERAREARRARRRGRDRQLTLIADGGSDGAA